MRTSENPFLVHHYMVERRYHEHIIYPDIIVYTIYVDQSVSQDMFDYIEIREYNEYVYL